MKRKLLIVTIVCVTMGLPNLLIAQDSIAKTHQNIVKLNVSSLISKTISLQYECIVGNKASVALGIRFTPKSTLPFHSLIEKSIKNDSSVNDDVIQFVRNSRISGFAITPEFRYYFGRNAGRGLYIAPFARYEQFNLQSTYMLKDDSSSATTPIPFKGSTTAIGIGLMLGAQFRLSDRLTLDCWILGPYYTWHKLKLSAHNLNLDIEDQANLKQSIQNTKISGVQLNATVTNNSAEVNAKGGLPVIRAFGLCLGFRI